MAQSGPIRLRIAGEGIAGNTYRVESDGKDISAVVTGVTVSLDVGEVNQAEIRYVCSAIEIEGEFEITHRCPLAESDS